MIASKQIANTEIYSAVKLCLQTKKTTGTVKK